jgi:hypothetical protein
MHPELESALASYLDSYPHLLKELKVAESYFERDFSLSGACQLEASNTPAFLLIVRSLVSCKALGLTLKEVSGDLGTDITDEILETWRNGSTFS